MNISFPRTQDNHTFFTDGGGIKLLTKNQFYGLLACPSELPVQVGTCADRFLRSGIPSSR
jgi:hypothetical protein